MSQHVTDTRSEAARRVQSRLPELHRQVLSFIVGQHAHGATDEEISIGLKMHPDTARARRVELRDAGLVLDSGKRRPTQSGRAATVWVNSTTMQKPAAAASQPSRPPATRPPTLAESWYPCASFAGRGR